MVQLSYTNTAAGAAGQQNENEVTQKMKFIALFHRRRRWGWFWKAIDTLGGRSERLADLDDYMQGRQIAGSRYQGIRSVAIADIQGSEGRSADFDRRFNPLQERTLARWLGIAAARQAGRVLPPVELIQVGEIFFVRDGHHRISVARALGENFLDAEVTRWNLRPAVAGQPGCAAGLEPAPGC